MNRQLSEYNQKRNFGRTTEPEGITVKSEEQLRFVVQHHIASKDHFDFRLEWNGTLLSWAVPKGPSFNPKDVASKSAGTLNSLIFVKFLIPSPIPLQITCPFKGKLK